MALKKSRRREAVATLAALTPERRQHDTIALVAAQIVDALGNISHPYRVQSLLDRLLDRGDIGQREWDAGQQFAGLYRRAALHQLRAADLNQEIRHRAADLPDGTDRARRQRDAALAALGGHGTAAGRCAWFVLGDEMSLAKWAQRDGWVGRPLREEAAKGILVGTLGALAGHFGL